jgi:asparagine synthase (glutamine-hydrolysing)
MCGFGGIVNSSRNVTREEALEVARCVSFRGPDSTNVVMLDEQWQATNNAAPTAVFFNRLAIIDLDARSNQPFQDKDHLLIFNGEIYNYQVIKAELASRGVQFKTTSDTEVLFHALITWGTAALSKVNGMFAFFWMNKRDHSFIIARDRIGIKPVLYKIEGESLIFASEMDSILRLSNEKHRVSAESVQRYLCLQYVPTPYTILDGIYKLPPGHYLAGTLSTLKQRKTIKAVEFWDGYKYILTSPDEEPQGDLESILAKSVESQMVADVPVGLFLSSGVDSSLLAAVINKHFKGRSANFFTVGFERETASDESRHASEYLKGFGNTDLHHHELKINQDLMIDKLGTLYDYYDEPFGDPASLLNWVISAKAREYVTVALSGDGADEMFWGYPRYNQWQRESERMYKRLPFVPAASRLANLMPESRMRYTLLDMGHADPVSIHFNILRPRLFGFLPAVENFNDLWCNKGLDKLKNRNDLPAVIDMKAYLADAMLYKVDRASMATSLEVRVPYLDNTVIDYALQLPLNRKSTAQFKNKAPLKELLTKLAPHYDVSKPKKGFSFPLSEWLQTSWKELVMETITKKNLEALNLAPAPFLGIVDKFYNKNVNCKDEVWYMMNLILWHNKFKKRYTGPK